MSCGELGSAVGGLSALAFAAESDRGCRDRAGKGRFAVSVPAVRCRQFSAWEPCLSMPWGRSCDDPRSAAVAVSAFSQRSGRRFA